MRDLISQILGNYNLQYDTSGDLVTGFAGLDYTWLIGAACFIVCLWSMFMLLGVLLKHLLK